MPFTKTPRDLTGQRFHKLVVLGRAETLSHDSRWICLCDCGATTVSAMHALMIGKTKSCGCLAHERLAAFNTTHGMSRKHRLEYAAWKGMKARCYQTTNPKYPRYGGRGITVCDEWRNDFPRFLADVGRKPAGHTLDRIDNDGPYAPGNVRWASPRMQSNNTRRNRRLTFNGETRTVSEWARRVGITPDALDQRLNRHQWTLERALTQPLSIRNR